MSITITDLEKKYGRKQILKRLSFVFEDGKKYAISSENGTGKTTLIRAILSQIHYHGEIISKNIISYCPEGAMIPSSMSAYRFIYDISNLRIKVSDFERKLKEYSSILGIEEKLKSACGSLSRGERQKISIIQCLITESDAIFFDEPLSGLDEKSKDEFVKIIDQDKRMSIIITHDISRFKNGNYEILKLKNGQIKRIS